MVRGTGDAEFPSQMLSAAVVVDVVVVFVAAVETSPNPLPPPLPHAAITIRTMKRNSNFTNDFFIVKPPLLKLL
jgi:translation initiation factor 2 gamma subunit (eIF-2gamma)